ncbi:hypothetical protein CUM63_13150 [Enterococcus faecium]|uniref:acyltransferase family protein n=1 Tax=Enterococcus faecium TaxID=1352 RepID=UPI000CF28614|nr:acyltransferase family protein [Enterococcus faecium]EME7223354.1 acyltransferase family protein [Enterococcus faecium]MCC4052805.1 acyltransferase family protein [Enterococcus faecium]MDQ8401630.1 acyltransferase family protein [Enterococcus faecium]PQD28488.1 hypothetical protein CUM63_13150 [Enterococcus faecium]
MNQNRKKYLDIAKGIGIILVVVGHSFPDESSPGGISILTFDIIKRIIYTFHMPLFFFISGYLAKKIILQFNFCQVFKKFQRLFIPYIFMSIVYIPLRIFLSKMATSTYPIKDLWKILIGISPNGGAWFLYVLLLVNIISIIFINKNNIYFILLLSFIATFVTRGNLIFISYSVLRYFCYNYFFFVIGLLCSTKITNFEEKLDNQKEYLFIILFGVLFLAYYSLNWTFLSAILAIIGVIVVLIISKHIENSNFSSTIKGYLCHLGVDSMYIYILHGPIQVLVRYIFWNKLELNYIVCVSFMFIFGLIGSLIIEHFIIKKNLLLNWALTGER